MPGPYSDVETGGGGGGLTTAQYNALVAQIQANTVEILSNSTRITNITVEAGEVLLQDFIDLSDAVGVLESGLNVVRSTYADQLTVSGIRSQLSERIDGLSGELILLEERVTQNEEDISNSRTTINIVPGDPPDTDTEEPPDIYPEEPPPPTFSGALRIINHGVASVGFEIENVATQLIQGGGATLEYNIVDFAQVNIPNIQVDDNGIVSDIGSLTTSTGTLINNGNRSYTITNLIDSVNTEIILNINGFWGTLELFNGTGSDVTLSIPNLQDTISVPVGPIYMAFTVNITETQQQRSFTITDIQRTNGQSVSVYARDDTQGTVDKINDTTFTITPDVTGQGALRVTIM